MASPAESGLRLEKYDVFEEIGHGGMATVYRARDRRLGRDVAVKVIHRHLRENKEVAARFVSEARAVAKLRHPNIVEVYDVSDERDDERYLVVELVPGTTLRKLLHEWGHMPAEVAAAVALEIGAALEHAHQAGVIHRDVKPENVLVDTSERAPSAKTSQERPADAEGRRVKITDFGIAKLLDAQGVTSTGQVLGSPAHMAPEQIEGGEVTARADVFGMGVLLYECMVGRLPFEGKNPAQVLRKVLDGTFTPPERARPTVGAAFSRIVERALARDEKDRFDSAEELCNALRTELDTLGFDNPRRELAEYLTAHEGYVAEYEARVVQRLVELGRAARSSRQPPLAAAYFNRALAFRPDDAELLRQVAGLAQSERLRRAGSRAGIALGVAALCAVAAYGGARWLRTPVANGQRLEPQPTGSVPQIAPETPRSEPTRAAPGPSAVPHDEKRPNGPKLGPLPSAVVAPSGKTRLVKIVVQGAKGGKVLVDGQPFAWFGPPTEMTLGVHTFEFLPPTADCCIPPSPLRVEITAGEGPQPVYGKIPFKPGFVSLAVDGATARCPVLFPGVLTGPGQRKVEIPGPEPKARDRCTVTGPSPGSEPKAVDVEVRPGATSSIPWAP